MLYRKLTLILLASFCLQSFDKRKHDPTSFILDYVELKYNQANLSNLIYIGVKRQKLYLISKGELQRVYDISTSKYGPGSQKGSEKTPIGLHRIKRKYGANVPFGGILVSRQYTGSIADINNSPTSTNRDDITSRILRLEGLESGINKGENIDSYQRNIYIHGTAEEGLIGKPVSHGCIRMRNRDVIELFDQVSEGVKVIILNN